MGRQERERLREAAETARIAAEDARAAAEAARDAAMGTMHAAAETLQTTLEHMKAVEEMRRTLRETGGREQDLGALLCCLVQAPRSTRPYDRPHRRNLSNTRGDRWLPSCCSSPTLKALASMRRISRAPASVSKRLPLNPKGWSVQPTSVVISVPRLERSFLRVFADGPSVPRIVLSSEEADAKRAAEFRCAAVRIRPCDCNDDLVKVARQVLRNVAAEQLVWKLLRFSGCDFEVLRRNGGTIQEDLELVFSGWPSIRLRDVELRSGVAGRRDRLRGLVDDLSILVGPARL